MLELQLESLWPFLRMLAIFPVVVFAASFLSNFLTELSVFSKLEPLLRPYVRITKIPPYLLPAVVSSLIDLRFEHMIVYTYYARGYLTDRYVVYYNLVLSPIRHIHISAVHIAPVAMATLGPQAGLLYVGLVYLKSMLTALLGYAYGRTVARQDLEKANSVTSLDELQESRRRLTPREAARAALSRTIRIFRKVMCRFLIVASAMAVLMLLGVFDQLNTVLEPMLRGMLGGLVANSQAIAVIVTGTFNPTLAMFVAGSLLSAGKLTIKDVLIALFLASLLFILLFDFTKHSFPFFASIYPVRVAAKLTLSLILTNLVTTPVIIALVLLLPLP